MNRDEEPDVAEPPRAGIARRPPLRLPRPDPEDTLRQIAIKATDAIGALEPRVNEMDSDLLENTSQLHVLSAQFQKFAEHLWPDRTHAPPPAPAAYDRRRRLPSLTEYNPEHTPMGGIKIDPWAWEALQQRILDQDIAAAAAKARAEGAAEALAKVQADASASEKAAEKKFKKWMKIAAFVATTGGGALGWIIHHFF